MISFEEATACIFENVSLTEKTICSLENAAGNVLFEDIVSDIDVGNFRNSAMDGFAIRSEWLKDCSEKNKITRPYKSTIFAGDPQTDIFSDGYAVKIMTGAPVPEGYNAVVKVEDTSFDENEVVFQIPVEKGMHIRMPGEDIRAGQKLFEKGQKLNPRHTGILAGIGLAEIPVYKKPSILIATTGNELAQPGEEIRAGQLYNSNLYTITSMVKPFCRSLDKIARITDERDSLESIMQSRHDIIITSGGVSAGDRDLVKPTAESEGWTTLFHKIKIKPGKPVFFARRGAQLFFGLPGNPLSSAVTCAILVVPALKKMMGYKDYQLQLAPARLGSTLPRKSDRMIIWPGAIRREGDEMIAEFSNKKSSAALTALLNTDGLIFQNELTENENPSSDVKFIWWNQIFDM